MDDSEGKKINKTNYNQVEFKAANNNDEINDKIIEFETFDADELEEIEYVRKREELAGGRPP